MSTSEKTQGLKPSNEKRKKFSERLYAVFITYISGSHSSNVIHNVTTQKTTRYVSPATKWPSGARKLPTSYLRMSVLKTKYPCCYISPARSKQCWINKVKPICGTNHKQVRGLLKAIHLCQKLWDNSVHHPTWIPTSTPIWCQRIQLIKEDYAWRRSSCFVKHYGQQCNLLINLISFKSSLYLIKKNQCKPWQIQQKDLTISSH